MQSRDDGQEVQEPVGDRGDPEVIQLRELANDIRYRGLRALAEASNLRIPLTSGGPQQFPRGSYDDEVAKVGLAALRAQVEQVASSLYALAYIKEHNLGESPILRALVQPYITALQQAVERQSISASSPTTTAGPDNPLPEVNETEGAATPSIVEEVPTEQEEPTSEDT